MLWEGMMIEGVMPFPINDGDSLTSLSLTESGGYLTKQLTPSGSVAILGIPEVITYTQLVRMMPFESTCTTFGFPIFNHSEDMNEIMMLIQT